jgi:transposase
MPVEHYIAMDTHSYSTDVCVKTRANLPGRRWRVPTTIPELRKVIESIRRPRHLAFEEGPLASWLYRNLKNDADVITVCDPRKNAWIAKGGDKDDPIDAAKLADLLAGGYLKAVHHSDELARDVFKAFVGSYHERVGHRVAAGNKVIGAFKRHGVVIRQRDFADKTLRPALMERLPADAAMAPAKLAIELLLEAFDLARRHECQLRRELLKLSKEQERIVRLTALPGIAHVRAATLVAYLDTPWRFRSKQALWKYLGIGLVRKTSGSGPVQLGVDPSSNRVLKSVILGAAKSAIAQGDNPFARQHQRWKEGGLSPRNARRNVARSLAAVAWGMMKSGNVYEADRVDRPAGDASDEPKTDRSDR